LNRSKESYIREQLTKALNRLDLDDTDEDDYEKIRLHLKLALDEFPET